jgi:hypothetical protein
MGIPPDKANDPANAAKIEKFLSKVKEIGGKNLQVAPIPYTFINGEIGAVTLSLLRIKDENGHYHFIDNNLEDYGDVQSWLDKTKLPAGRVVFPTDGLYTLADGEGHFDLNSRMTPASEPATVGERIKEGLDFATLVGGVLACGVLIVASGGTVLAVAAGYVASGSLAWQTASSGYDLYEVGKKGKLLSWRGGEAVLTVAASGLGFGALAKTRGLRIAASVANVAAIVGNGIDLAANAGDMTKSEFAKSLGLLLFSGGVMAVAYVRTPNRPIEAGTPFSQPGAVPGAIPIGRT